MHTGSVNNNINLKTIESEKTKELIHQIEKRFTDAVEKVCDFAEERGYKRLYGAKIHPGKQIFTLVKENLFFPDFLSLADDFLFLGEFNTTSAPFLKV